MMHADAETETEMKYTLILLKTVTRSPPKRFYSCDALLMFVSQDITAYGLSKFSLLALVKACSLSFNYHNIVQKPN